MIHTVRKIRATAIVAGMAAVAAYAAPPDIALEVDGRKHEARGQGECRHAPRASIYGVAAAMYSVSHRADGRSITLTVWQPSDGAAMMNLRISDGKDRYVVDTVKAGKKQDTKGSGKATLRKSGEGATIVIDAVTASGRKVAGHVACPAFDGIRAEGG